MDCLVLIDWFMQVLACILFVSVPVEFSCSKSCIENPATRQTEFTYDAIMDLSEPGWLAATTDCSFHTLFAGSEDIFVLLSTTSAETLISFLIEVLA